MPKQFYAIFALILAAMACNWADIVPPAAPVIEPSPLPTFAIPTITPSPTVTPLPTPTSTPDAPIAWAGELGVNCRYGPGQEWEVVSIIPAETIVEIKGRTVNTAWWFIEDPLQADTLCWVSYDVMETAGNMNIIPIVEAPAASVTAVTVDAMVTFNACGSDNPVTFSGQIETNGPTIVTFYWEVSGDAQFVIPDNSLQMSESGTKKVTTNLFSADCGAYTVKLFVENPNAISAEKAFNIQGP